MRFTIAEVFNARDGLAQMHDDISAFVVANGPDPDGSSMAVREERSYPVPTLIFDAHSQSMCMIESCGDHLTALIKTVTPPHVEVMAPWSCFRIITELAATAAWLVNPKLLGAPAERARRSWLQKRESLRYRRVFADDTDKSDVAVTDARIQELYAQAKAAGLTVNKNTTRPPATEIIKTVCGRSWEYRLSSGVMHGHMWVLDILYDKSPAPSRSTTGVETRRISKVAKPDMLMYAIISTAAAFARPVWYHAQYMGWDTGALTDILERGFDGMNLSDENRIWRKYYVPIVPGSAATRYRPFKSG